MIGEDVFPQQRGREWDKDHAQEQDGIGIDELRRCFVHQFKSGVMVHPRDEDDHEAQEKGKYGWRGMPKRQPKVIRRIDGRRWWDLDIDDQQR